VTRLDAEFVLHDRVDHCPTPFRFPQVPAGPETLLDPVWEQYSLPTHLLGCDLYFGADGHRTTTPRARCACLHDLGVRGPSGILRSHLQVYLARWIRNACMCADRIARSSQSPRMGREKYGVLANLIDVIHHGVRPAPDKKNRQCRGRRAVRLCIRVRAQQRICRYSRRPSAGIAASGPGT